MNQIRKFIPILVNLILVGSMSAKGQTDMKVEDIFPVSGNEHYDGITSGKDNRLYIAHGSEVSIIDKKHGEELSVIEGLNGAYSIALDYEDNKGFISNRNTNEIAVFNLSDDKILTYIQMDENPGNLIYAATYRQLIILSKYSNIVTFIDPLTGLVNGKIALDGIAGDAAIDEKEGKLMVSLPDQNEIDMLNLKTGKVEMRIPTGTIGSEPSSIAIDNKHKLIFAGCNDNKLLVLSYENGKILTSLPIEGKCASVAYSEELRSAFVSSPEGILTVLKQKKPNKYETGIVRTMINAGKIAVDDKRFSVYVPSADYTQIKDDNDQYLLFPNSFKIIRVK